MTELQESIMFPSSKTIEELEEIAYLEELQRKKDKALRCKMLCLEKMGKHPLFNVSNMNQREKKKLIVMVREMFDNVPDIDIINDFNEMCSESIFDLKEDYTTYSIKNPVGMAEPPPFECDMKIEM